MPLFQKSVLNKYLREQNDSVVHSAFERFQAYFNNPQIQQNILNSKEEQFQEGFLLELFVRVFGFVMNPNPDFNLTTEFKNEKGARKADGAVLIDGKAVAVIELKSTKTKDLETIRQQAFDYKSNQSSCVYVITSNFQKLRFYINHAVEFEEFDLFSLTEDRFSILYLCLNSANLLSDLPLKIKNDSILVEEQITKKFYDDYSNFKKDLFDNIALRNLDIDGVTKLHLYKKTQKLLDRFLFIFFAEDRNLLPPNSISRMIKRWNLLSEEDAYKPLYDIYKQYFGYINTGRKGKTAEGDIHAYNGGLFLPDEILDRIIIDDEVLLKHTTILTNYDFESQVDVNILGHIFEHSLNEIESTTAELEGVDFDKQKSKRKKDGVFYTPKYITKYIVDNTVGKLCEEKKTELGIVDEEFTPNRQKDTKRKLLTNLEAYRSWLLELTICDPACGSGAFLNQALEFLITEHHYIDQLNAQLFGSTMVFQDVENQILEKNIYGVDINEESVDIARLSLWLRTAHRGRKLTTLNNNIKCGNSLIDDPEVAGDKAFIWEREFPEIFAKGGFDVVIGNPPYLRIQGLRESYPKLTKYYDSNYVSATGNFDIYALFIEKSYHLINEEGIVSFILPHKFLIADFGKGVRGFLLRNNAISEIVHFGSELVFKDATTYTCIISISKKMNTNLCFKHSNPLLLFSGTPFSHILYEKLDEGQWILNENKIESILEKVFKQPLQLKEIFDRFVQGIITGKDAVYCVIGQLQGDYLEIVDESDTRFLIEKTILKPHLRGEDVSKYKRLFNNEWLIFPYKISSGRAELYTHKEMQDKFPKALYYLNQHEKGLRARENGSFDNDNWYQYSRNQAISVLEQPKIITPEICYGGSMTIDRNSFYHNSKCHSLLLHEDCGYSLESILPFLNSQLFWFYLSKTGNVLRGGYVGVKRRVMELFPVPEPDIIDHELCSSFTKKLMIAVAELQDIQSLFIELLKSKFGLLKLSKRLQNWHELEFSEFLKELSKAKVKLSLSEEAEWMQYFNEQKQRALSLKAEINRIDKEIDQMVYQLYGLTEEEIRIVEES